MRSLVEQDSSFLEILESRKCFTYFRPYYYLEILDLLTDKQLCSNGSKQATWKSGLLLHCVAYIALIAAKRIVVRRVYPMNVTRQNIVSNSGTYP